MKNSPTIGMTFLFKDKSYLLLNQILYHRAVGVDFFYLYLVNADTKTTDMVKDLASMFSFIKYKEINTRIFDEENLRTQVSEDIYNSYAVDWVINNDEDEFWVPESGTLKNLIAMAEKKNANCIFSKRYNYLPEDISDSNLVVERARYLIIDPIKLSKSRRNSNISPEEFILRKVNGKCIYKPSDTIKVEAGAHYIKMKNKRFYKPYKNKIMICHFSYSSKDLTFSEMKERSSIFVERSSLRQSQAWHLRTIATIFNEGKLREFVNAIFDIHIEEYRSRLQKINKVKLILDQLYSDATSKELFSLLKSPFWGGLIRNSMGRTND